MPALWAILKVLIEFVTRDGKWQTWLTYTTKFLDDLNRFVLIQIYLHKQSGNNSINFKFPFTDRSQPAQRGNGATLPEFNPDPTSNRLCGGTLKSANSRQRCWVNARALEFKCGCSIYELGFIIWIGNAYVAVAEENWNKCIYPQTAMIGWPNVAVGRMRRGRKNPLAQRRKRAVSDMHACASWLQIDHEQHRRDNRLGQRRRYAVSMSACAQQRHHVTRAFLATIVGSGRK